MRGALPNCSRWPVNIVTAYERPVGEIHRGTVIKIDGHFRELVLLGGRTNDVGVDQFLQLLGTKSRLELERSAQERLGDSERRHVVCGGGHCDCGMGRGG